MKKKITTIIIFVLLAFVFWVAIALTQEYVTTIQAKIIFEDLPKNYSVGIDSPEQIYIQIKGKGWNLLKTTLGKKEEFIVSVHNKYGKKRINLRDYVSPNNWLSSNYQVIEISPSQIEFEVEREISKTVRIVQNFKVEFKEGYNATSDVVFEPHFVEIYGVPSLVNKIDTIQTVYTEFKDVSENFDTQIQLEEIPGIKFSNENCQVKFEVQKIVDRNFENVPVIIKNTPKEKELLLYPNKVNVILRGGINKLGKWTNDSINVYIDYNKTYLLKENFIEPVIEIPEFINLISVEPKKLEFVIKQN